MLLLAVVASSVSTVLVQRFFFVLGDGVYLV